MRTGVEGLDYAVQLLESSNLEWVRHSAFNKSDPALEDTNTLRFKAAMTSMGMSLLGS